VPSLFSQLCVPTIRQAWGTALVICAALGGSHGYAAEGGIGVYILGSRGPMAGYTPPPGVYFQNDFLHYRASFDASRAFPSGAPLVGTLGGYADVDLLTPFWVTPLDVLGGNLAFALTIPVGNVRLTADPPFASSLGLGAASRTDSTSSVGDIYAHSFVGWHAGDWHWRVGATAVIPSGAYQPGALGNIALNRPAVDVFGGVTWLDPKIGLELSAIAGLTYNGENRVTHYRTGNELHVDWTVAQHFSPKFWAGLVGYHYQQLTGDSGTGAFLGDFKGRVTGLGGAIGTTLMMGQTPISANVRVYWEFETQNRFEGTVGYLTFAMPLYLHSAPPTAVVAKN
jgi:hypothetical protein